MGTGGPFWLGTRWGNGPRAFRVNTQLGKGWWLPDRICLNRPGPPHGDPMGSSHRDSTVLPKPSPTRFLAPLRIPASFASGPRRP